jgi:hypothetical protein
MSGHDGRRRPGEQNEGQAENGPQQLSATPHGWRILLDPAAHQDHDGEHPMPILLLINLKGGIAKTTHAVAIGLA